MKYAVFYKKFDELDISDFDEEVLNQYENLTLRKEGLSYIVNGQEVITTIDNFIQDICEKQIEYIFDDFAERTVKKMHEAVEKEPSEDLISKKDVIDELEYEAEMLKRVLDNMDIVGQEREKFAWSLELVECFIEDIKKLSSAEPKRGKWRDIATELDASFKRHEFVCSECDCIANYFVGGSEDWWDTRKPNYCPNCGARMESDEE